MKGLIGVVCTYTCGCVKEKHLTHHDRHIDGKPMMNEVSKTGRTTFTYRRVGPQISAHIRQHLGRSSTPNLGITSAQDKSSHTRARNRTFFNLNSIDDFNFRIFLSKLIAKCGEYSEIDI